MPPASCGALAHIRTREGENMTPHQYNRLRMLLWRRLISLQAQEVAEKYVFGPVVRHYPMKVVCTFPEAVSLPESPAAPEEGREEKK